jgi:ATP-dependent helicase/nuclease subunit B
MNSRRLAHLQEIAQTSPLQRKVLVTRSNAIGHQWLERFSRENGIAANFEIVTPHSLAHRFARLPLREKGVAFMTAEDAYWLVHRLMRTLAVEESQPYVPMAMLSPSVVQCFHSAVNELRHALVRSERLTPEWFESAAKGEYIRKLLERYERHLARHSLADEAELRLYVEPDPQTQTVYVLDRHLQLSAAEREMLHIIAGDRVQELEADVPFTMNESAFPAADTEFFHVLGPVAEVREVFRRLAVRRIPPDQAEIIVSDEGVYIPAVYTLALNHGIPCTFSRGIPIDYTVTGQAVRLYLDWLESGYRLEPILQALKQGIVRLSTAEEATTSSLIRILEKSGIGWGRERYELLRKMPPPPSVPEAPASITGHVPTPAIKLADWFDQIFAVLPTEDCSWSPGAVAEGLSLMLKSVPARNEDETQVQAEIRRLAETLRLADIETMNRAMAIRHVRERTERMTFGASGIPSSCMYPLCRMEASPGALIRHRRHGREWLGHFHEPRSDPAGRRTDGIDPRLITAKERAECEERSRAERLGAVRGRCTMSFSSFRTADKQERNAAFEMLLCYRRQTGNAEAGYEEMLRALPPAAGVLHSAAGVAIDSQEAWLKAFDRRGAQYPRRAARYWPPIPVYPKGQKRCRAERSRRSASMTVYSTPLGMSRCRLRRA